MYRDSYSDDGDAWGPPAAPEPLRTYSTRSPQSAYSHHSARSHQSGSHASARSGHDILMFGEDEEDDDLLEVNDVRLDVPEDGTPTRSQPSEAKSPSVHSPMQSPKPSFSPAQSPDHLSPDSPQRSVTYLIDDGVDRDKVRSAEIKANLCTFCLVVAWIIVALALGLYGLALASLLPRLDALPVDTYNGFITVIGFDKLQDDAREVTDAAKAALAVCGTTPTTCETASFPNVVNTMIQLDRMNAAFSSSLTDVSKVVNDKYFGVEAVFGPDLGPAFLAVEEAMAQVYPVDSCSVQIPQFCAIHQNSLLLHVCPKEVDLWLLANADHLTTYEDFEFWWAGSHAIPYILLVSLLIFSCFWIQDAAGPWCGGTPFGCGLFVCFATWWAFFFVISTLMCILALCLKFGNTFSFESLRGNPCLEELAEHVQETFPEFWDLVWKEPYDQLYRFLQVVGVIEILSLLILIYACAVFLCAPYHNDAALKQSGATLTSC
eukprot:CAMPEP_0194495428 /NCGR_PEP_ID=MMETSP0253-20130528/13027_1 /TAXON_ID=2966 /ORGANISM="Noctiluca scintillans" /LENGTH=489 /DNA_ID=CAMNT_0039336681 /DNA_START=103 /DNA_END=1572 /DNA_ORIENTATION=-